MRDQLLGLPPKDYDVATDALPDQVREIFGRRKTLAIGAAFGVITVLGPQGRGADRRGHVPPRRRLQRRPAPGRGQLRRPPSRTPSAATSRSTACSTTRSKSSVIDYVGGQEDLQAGHCPGDRRPAARGSPRTSCGCCGPCGSPRGSAFCLERGTAQADRAAGPRAGDRQRRARRGRNAA